MAFLRQIISQLKEDYGTEISNLCIVVPTRRAVEFLREAIKEEYQETLWAPTMLSIQDFVRGLSGKQFPEVLPLVFELYQCYLDRMEEDQPGFREPLESFYAWGEMLVKDFDELDKYLVPADKLFRNIRELKEIDEFFLMDEESLKPIRHFWRTLRGEGKELTDIQEQFLKIWQLLYDIYTSYGQTLRERNLCYDGMAYREIIEALQAGQLELPYPEVIFVGFNALSRAEESLMEILLKQKRARVYWDVDSAYFSMDKKQALMTGEEPGKFIKEYHSKWKELESHLIIHHMMEEEKKVFHTGVPLQVGQAQYLGNLLRKEAIREEDYRKTALVLADEKLLFPVLYALPADIKRLNITMGFPLRQTNIFNLLMSLMRLLRNMKEEQGQLQFGHKDVVEILNNPYIKANQSELSEHIQGLIQKHNWVFIKQKDLQDQDLKSLLLHIFSPPAYTGTKSIDLEKVLSYCKSVFNHLLSDAQVRENHLETEYIFKFSLSFNQLEQVLLRYKPPLSIIGFARLFREVIQKLRIPFEGKPLEGVQLMGFLETRVLDFERVFILSANEGSLPDTSTGNSFIPYNLRKGFGLPTYEEKDAIYAYHFYRLLQRSREVHLIYNSVVSDSTGGAKEVSRFIRQIRHFFRDQRRFDIQEGLVSTHAPYAEQNPICIDSSSDTLELFKNRFGGVGGYLSATAFTTWISCPLKFYFKYLANIREPKEVEESMEANTLGTVLHELMEQLYQKYLGQEITDEILDHLIKSIDQGLEQVFVDHGLGKVSQLQGKNYLLHRVIKRLSKRMLEHDKHSPTYQIVGLEDAVYRHSVRVEGHEFVINGSLDRVDYLTESSTVRILDYKTGKVSLNDSAPLENIFADFKNKEMFQGFLYAWLYKNKHPESKVKVGYYTARHLNDGIQYLRQGRDIENLELKEFGQRLRELIKQMYTEDYTQTEDVTRCSYCPYNAICNR